jgi:cell division protein FtsI/penicillin-binding protein 2
MKSYVITALLLGGVIHSLQLGAATPSKPAAKSSKKTVKKKARPKEPAVDPTVGDNVDGDDLTIRRAAVDALGTVNGSVVVVDPNSGRILTMVNQRLALASGFTPCSTIKLVTSLAALTEHVVTPEANLRINRYATFNLTTAIAHSNNEYFGILGNRLGFERVTRYAQMLGLGEKAGLNIEGEQPGQIPAEPPKWGGVGLMTSFGEGFLVTPLELAALLSSIANGGTMYYMQYPRNGPEIEAFTPQVKRKLDVDPEAIADIKIGMRGAVDYGTAKRANYDPSEPILGKTGTCTDFRASHHMGWFGSFNDVGRHQLVVVVMLAGGTKAVSGPVAAGVAGAIYRSLSEQRYFAAGGTQPGTPEILTTYPCCQRQ